MPPIKRITLSFLLLFVCYCTYGQSWQPRFIHLNSEDGLSQNSVNDIYQDELGYIWLATQDGLNRYDGYEFEVFKPDPDNPWSISDNFITRIEPDTNGNIWFFGRYGLNYYESSSGRFYKFYTTYRKELSVPNGVFKLDKHWYAIFLYETHQLPTTFASPSTFLDDTIVIHDSILQVYPVGDKILACSHTNYFVFDEKLNLEDSVRIDRDLFPYQGIWLRNGRYFFCASNAIYELDSLYRFGEPIVELPPGNNIQDMLVHNDSSFWIGHVNGLVRFKSNQFQFVSANGSESKGLSYPLVHSLYQDRSGNVWIGTANGGVNLYPSGASRFTHFSDGSGLSHNQVWSVYQDHQNQIWVGTEQGLDLIKDGKILSSQNKVCKRFKNSRITAITEDSKHRLWVGTSREGLYRVHGDGSVQQIPIPGETKYYQSVSCFLEQVDTMWVGTLGKLLWVEGNDDVHTLENPTNESFDYLRYILSLDLVGNNLHIGSAYPHHIYNTRTGSLDSYRYASKRTGAKPSFQFATGIHGNKDSVWLATFGGGLNLFETNTKTYTYFDSRVGLNNDVLASVVATNNQLWLAHNLGISRFDISQQRFTNYILSDGVPFREFSLGAGNLLNDGSVAFGGTDGLVILDPTDFDEHQIDLTPIITELTINYDSVINVNKVFDTIRLYPESKVISIRFAAMDFLHANDLSYQYKLEGFNQDWVTAPIAERRAVYSNLPDGTYTLLVRVADVNKQWTDQQLELTILVFPPIWMRWWFVAGCILLIVFIVTYSIRFYYKIKLKRKMREMEMQQRVHKERERISMDLHDHVGAQLTYLISNLDRLELEKKADSTKLSKLGVYAREAMSELRDTVWAIRKDSMRISETKHRIAQFGNGLFSQSHTQFRVDSLIENDVLLQPAPALHILRIVQEALHNAKKHSRATLVEVSIKTEGHVVSILVNDDGVGIQNMDVDDSVHNGLRNMNDRASEIRAIFSVESTHDSGTCISIKYDSRNKASALSESGVKT